MPATDIILQKPFVLIQQTGSELGVNTGGGGILSGMIVNIYQTSDMYTIGDVVSYRVAGQEIISYENIDYSLVTEDKIFYKEIVAP